MTAPAQQFRPSSVEINFDGKTVWVNSADGCCIGRFSRQGIDIHHDAHEQMRRGQQCLDCRKGPTAMPDWIHFQEAMLRHFNVVVSDRYMPTFLRLACTKPRICR